LRGGPGRLGEFLDLDNGIPSHDTFRRVLSALRPKVIGACVRLWQRAAAGRLDGACVSLDGKAVRRACAKGAGTCPQGDRRAGMAVRRKSRNPVPLFKGPLWKFLMRQPWNCASAGLPAGA